MRYFLDFQSDDYGKKIIDEPFGASGINFSLNQKPDGMGRDISFSGGEITFEFTYLREHELKQLLYYKRKFGFEALVVLTIEIDENNKYTADLDFATSETDDIEYFKCKGIEDGKLQIVKARKSVKVDLLSNTDVDGNFITPLVPVNMLLLAKPVIQLSSWTQTEVFNTKITAQRDDSQSTVFGQINPCINLLKANVEDSFTFFQTQQLNGDRPFTTKSPFQLLTAANNLQNVNVKLYDLDFNFNTDVDNGGNGFADVKIIVRYGATFENSIISTVLSETRTENKSFIFQGGFDINIPVLNRGESVWVFFDVKVRQSASNPPFIVRRFELFLNILSMKTDITAESTSYNSVSKSLRLVDVMRQVVRSIAGLEINAPRFEAGGEFYDNRLVNGNFLRGRADKPFTVSLEDIEKSLTEFKGDYEIGSDGKVFFGIEADFYTGVESGFFDNTQFEQMSKSFNPKYTINEFNFKYNKYQSLKENEELNSADSIHGESKLVFFNKNVENKKEVEVSWIRDAFLIETNRRKAITLTDETASQDDDDLFCIDSINTTFNNEFTEVAVLQHSFNSETQKLSIRNDGTINFISLGVQVDSTLIIRTIDLNAGAYRVFSVNGTELILTRLLGATTSAGDGIRDTKFTYTLDQSFVPFTNYTAQGFTQTTGLNAPESYSNRRYSVGRNIFNFYKSYLATCNLFWKNRPIKNTFYKNNGEYSAKFNGIVLKENADLVPDNPILSPVLYNNIIFANVAFSDYIILQNKIRSERGFIRTLDNSNTVVKIYPVEMSYALLEQELTIKAEEKFQPTNLTISTEFDYILINNETRLQKLNFEIENGKVFLFDENRFRLYNGVYWFEVSINGAIPVSLEELKNSLSLL
jgi:hypothetical protein